MSTPVHVQYPALTLSTTEVPGYLTIESGQSTSLMEISRASLVHIALVYPSSHPIDVAETNGFTVRSNYGVNTGILGWFNTMVLEARTEDITFPIELPITVPSGGWVEGMATLIRNAKPSGSPGGSDMSAHELSIDRKRTIYSDSSEMGDVPHRLISYLLLFKNPVSQTPPQHWLGGTTAGIENISSTGPILIPGTDDYLNLFVVPTPEMYEKPNNYAFTYHFWGGEFVKSHMTFFRIDEDYPPLCGDPTHVPVTITITAHGPIDVQVDPAE